MNMLGADVNLQSLDIEGKETVIATVMYFAILCHF